MLYIEPLFSGTRFAYPAPDVSCAQRLAEIDQMRLVIRDHLARTLAAEPSVAIIDPDADVRESVAAHLRNGAQPVRVVVYDHPEALRRVQLGDAWLVVIAVDESAYDAVIHIMRLQRAMAEPMIVGRAGAAPLADRGELYDIGVEVLLQRGERTRLPAYLPLIADRRRTLPARLERRLLTKQVIVRFGTAALADAGLVKPQLDCPSFSESEYDLIMRALIVAEGVRRNAARILGISPATLYRRLALYGLEDFNPAPRRRR